MESVILWEGWLVFNILLIFSISAHALDFIKPDNLRLNSRSSLYHRVSATDALQEDYSELTIE